MEKSDCIKQKELYLGAICRRQIGGVENIQEEDYGGITKLTEAKGWPHNWGMPLAKDGWMVF